MATGISFIIPVLNAEQHLHTCLKSIRAQDYPAEAVEIIVLDGGSTDSTVGIAGHYMARVEPNPQRLAEYGLQVGIKAATKDLVTIFAADNELSSKDWIKTAVAAFESGPGCSAVWGPLKSGPDDPAVNKYFELIQSDPMTFFMNKNISGYLNDEATIKSNGAFFFRVDPKRPLVWGANGLTMRRSLISHIWARHGYLGDNDAFQQMVEEGNSMVAFIPGLVTYHHHVGAVTDFIHKWKRNFSVHFLDKIETRNTNWVFTENFRKRLFLWLIYSTNPLISGTHAVFMGMRDRNRFWAYHPLLCMLQTFVYAWIMVATPKGRQMAFKIARGLV